MKEYEEMENNYREPALSWLTRYINKGAADLAGFYFGRFRRWRIPYVELATLFLEQAGLQGAFKGRDEVLKEEDSPYLAAFKGYTEVIDRMTADAVTPPSPRAIAEIVVAYWETEIKISAMICMELA